MKWQKILFDNKGEAYHFFDSIVNTYKEVHLIKDYSSAYYVVCYRGDLD